LFINLNFSYLGFWRVRLCFQYHESQFLDLKLITKSLLSLIYITE
jgi:hypothetical protein